MIQAGQIYRYDDGDQFYADYVAVVLKTKMVVSTFLDRRYQLDASIAEYQGALLTDIFVDTDLSSPSE